MNLHDAGRPRPVPTIPTAPWHASRSPRACRKRCSTSNSSRRTGLRSSRTRRPSSPQLDKLAPPDALLASSTSAIMASRLHRSAAGPGALPRRAIPSIRRIWCRWSNCAAHRGPRPTPSTARRDDLSRDRPGAGDDQPRNQRLRPEPPAGRAAGGSLPARRRRLVSSAEDLDHTVKDGLGLRWSFSGRSRPSNSMPPAASRITARATPASTRNWPRRPPAPTSYQSPNVDRVIAAWPHQPAAGAHRCADATAQRAAGGIGRAQGQTNTDR